MLFKVTGSAGVVPVCTGDGSGFLSVAANVCGHGGLLRSHIGLKTCLIIGGNNEMTAVETAPPDVQS